VPPALAAPSSAVVAPARADDELTLAALMDLFEPEELDVSTSTSPTTRTVLRSTADRLRTWRHEWSLWSVKVTVRLGGARRAW
jgi:hypothetical protein